MYLSWLSRICPEEGFHMGLDRRPNSPKEERIVIPLLYPTILES
jgi:hypothetical protein